MRKLALLVVAAACLVLPAPASASVPAHGRAWELVSPASSVAGKVAATGAPLMPGERLIYLSFGPMPGSPAGLTLSYNLAQRDSDGWVSTPVGFPFSAQLDGVVEELLPLIAAGPIEEDPVSLWLSVTPLSPTGPPDKSVGLYRRFPDNTFTPIVDFGEQPLFQFDDFIDQSKGATHVVFSREGHLLAADAGRVEGSSIYESVGDAIRLVEVDDGGTLLSPCGSTMSHANGISVDGERIFFTSPGEGTACPGPRKVYLREGGAQTIEVSGSQCTRPDCDAPQDATFAAATPSGDSAFLTTAQQLTNDDTDSSRDLYRYDRSDGMLTLVSASLAAGDDVAPDPVHSSDDGANVYFYATNAAAGTSLYLADSDGLHLVAAGGPGKSEWNPEEPLQLARGGRIALFSTAGANAGDSDDKEDVYLYDADRDSLTRLSQGPTGGGGSFDASIVVSTTQEFVFGRPMPYRAVSEDGTDAFFSTQEQLVPEDVNDAIDVYEWKGGQVGLVSAGTGPSESQFSGIGPDGKTAFFLTSDMLLGADQDGGSADLYAARIGGGFPEPPAPPGGCDRTVACPPAPGARASRPLPASAAHRSHRKHGRIRLLRILYPSANGPTGAIEPVLLAAVPSPGRVSASATGRGERARKLARGEAGAIRPGKIRIPLRLTRLAQSSLRHGRALSARLTIAQGDRRLTRTLEIDPGARR